MLSERKVAPEILDALPANDPVAKASRKDLVRLNWWMASSGRFAQALSGLQPKLPARIVELGTGDGGVLLETARKLGPSWKGTEALLLDRQPVVSKSTLRGFADCGWKVRVETLDVLFWLETSREQYDIIVTNLFLHHFESGTLRTLLERASARTSAFVALEPRRESLPFLISRNLWLLRCNRVTRYDAVLSVRAGFRGQELHALWPPGNWLTSESRAGAFSHLFIAQKGK